MQKNKSTALLEAELAERNKELAKLLRGIQTGRMRLEETQNQILANASTAKQEAGEFKESLALKTESLTSERAALAARMAETLNHEATEAADDEDEDVDGLGLDGDGRRKTRNTGSFDSENSVAEAIHTYEQAFDAISKQAEGLSVDEMVEQFIESEHRNFSLLNLVNELNREVEEQQHINMDLHTSIKDLKGLMGDGTSRKEVFANLEKRIQAAQAAAAEYDGETSKISPVVNDMKKNSR